MSEQPLPRCQQCGHLLGRRDKKCALCGTLIEQEPQTSVVPAQWLLVGVGAGLALLAVSFSALRDRSKPTASVDTHETIATQDSRNATVETRGGSPQPESRAEVASNSSAPALRVETGDREKAVQAFASGQSNLRNGHYDVAIQEFTKALRLNPSYGEAFTNRGFVYLFKADYDRAIEDFAAAIQIQPNTDLFANRALAHFNKAEYDRAIQDYTEAIRLSSADPELFNYRGASYSGMSDYDRAIQDYNQAIRLNPNYPTALNNRGWAYAQKGDRERALADYVRALKLKPEPPLRQHLEAALKSLDLAVRGTRHPGRTGR